MSTNLQADVKYGWFKESELKIDNLLAEDVAELVLKGQADSLVRRFTRVYVKTKGKWQLVATHISRVEAQKQESKLSE